MCKKMTRLAVLLCGAVMITACGGSKKISSASNLDSGNLSSGLAAEFTKNVGDRVFFKFDSSAVSDEGRVQLDKQTDWLKTHADVKALIEGHCDERGSTEYNLGLGERRANSVKKYLVKKGLDTSRLDTISYGKEKPSVIGSGEEVWKQNRRAVTVVGQ